MNGDLPLLQPVRGKARIDVLDMLRGIAILGIFYMNIPLMAGPAYLIMRDARAMGWSLADQHAWAFIVVTWEGTQRGLLEFLFGAGMMVLTAKAMRPDGPVAVADLFQRRCLWLLLFGLADVFLMLWPGDILHIYGLAALFLFPFRKLGARTLIILGLSFATFSAVQASFEYAARTQMIQRLAVAKAHERAGLPFTREDRAAAKEWQTKRQRIGIDKETAGLAAEEAKARNGSFTDYAQMLWNVWLGLTEDFLWPGIAEAFCAMLIGAALWKLGIIQGQRSTAFYAWLVLVGYGFGLTARWVGAQEIMTFQPIPKTILVTGEYARLAVSLGHVALVNLLARTGAGRLILSPFKAAGRFALSAYFLEQFIGTYLLFSPLFLHLRGPLGWARLAWMATGVVAILLVIANLWARYFAMGPMEWAWRSLAYGRRQPFRKRPSREGEATGGGHVSPALSA